MNKFAILEELKRRKAEELKQASKPSFIFEEYCFEAQRKFLRGEGPRYRTAVCSRRAGKTIGIAADLLDTCMNEPNVTCLYITLTQQNARNIIWGDLLNMIEEYEIECKVDNTRLSVKFKNSSRIVIAGAKDRQEIEKYRGWKLKKCYIDECQSFRPYIKELIDDIITAALRDLKGTLYLTGTPGPIPAGPFYEYSHSEFWDNHHWTAFDNPHMHNPPKLDLEETLEEERRMKGIDKNNPGYQRETYGIWVEDKDSLVFKFNKEINVQSTPIIGEMTYILGVDIGFNDADALAILGYNSVEKKIFLVEEMVNSKQNITELVKQIKQMQDKYKPVKMVMDAGALGKKIQEEIRTRHGIHMEAADKNRKVEFIELLNDDLRTGKFKAYKGSRFEEDSYLVQWDRESMLTNPDKPKISDTYHSDITDAVLYAWRECRHYLSERPKDQPEIGTNAYMDELEKQEAQAMEARKNDPYYDSDQELFDDFETSVWDDGLDW